MNFISFAVFGSSYVQKYLRLLNTVCYTLHTYFINSAIVVYQLIAPSENARREWMKAIAYLALGNIRTIEDKGLLKVRI